MKVTCCLFKLHLDILYQRNYSILYVILDVNLMEKFTQQDPNIAILKEIIQSFSYNIWRSTMYRRKSLILDLATSSCLSALLHCIPSLQPSLSILIYRLLYSVVLDKSWTSNLLLSVTSNFLVLNFRIVERIRSLFLALLRV